MIEFSIKTRANTISKLVNQQFDVIIIGGGITGAGVLRDASLRGMNALLLEKNDFASGTSSKSSKLIHGGLRYLKHFDFSLVRESCHERNLLMQQNPHLIRPMPFLFPIYEEDKEGPFLVRLGMWLYEILSGFKNYKRFKMLSKKEALEYAPTLNPNGLKGAAYYFDADTDDVRLTLENIKSAIYSGGYALNYTPVKGFIKDSNDKITGVRVLDLTTNQYFEFKTHSVINVAGVWMDEIRNLDKSVPPEIVPAKGVHIVVPRSRINPKVTVAFSTFQDKRMIFCIPKDEHVALIGTTDTFHHGSVDSTPIDDIDVQYLLDATNKAFPSVNLTKSDVISTWAGFRPLLTPKKDVKNASDVSREHQIFEDKSGIISIAGGKLTTYRTMAKNLLDMAILRVPSQRKKTFGPCITEQALIAGENNLEKITNYIISKGYSKDIATNLISSYGPNATFVADYCEKFPNGKSQIKKPYPYLTGEVAFSVEYESAIHLVDILSRRLRFSLWVEKQGIDVALDVAKIMGQVLNWPEEIIEKEVSDFIENIRLEYSLNKNDV